VQNQATHLRVTDQMAILDGNDTKEDRENGWCDVLDKLQHEVT
jgi:hypothetical protein